MLAIINDAAQAYRGVIPADRWREPYMPRDELEKEIAEGVTFWVAEEEGCLLPVKGESMYPWTPCSSKEAMNVSAKSVS